MVAALNYDQCHPEDSNESNFKWWLNNLAYSINKYCAGTILGIHGAVVVNKTSKVPSLLEFFQYEDRMDGADGFIYVCILDAWAGYLMSKVDFCKK